jgi:hypothetical protein
VPEQAGQSYVAVLFPSPEEHILEATFSPIIVRTSRRSARNRERTELNSPRIDRRRVSVFYDGQFAIITSTSTF